MQITTLPVYSKLADPAEIEKELPLHQRLREIEQRSGKPFQLSQHQLETYRALIAPDVDVVINTAMTGDGKSLAAYLPTLIHDCSVLAMYPTNELIRDQYQQLISADGYLPKFKRQDVTCQYMHSEMLSELQTERGIVRRGDAIMSLRRNNDVVLTNPDIYHYIMHLCYLRKKIDVADKYFVQLNNFSQHFIFDEFHVFQAPQVTAIINALILTHFTIAPSQRRKFLFLSATPNVALQDAIYRAGLRCYTNNTGDVIKGAYLHTDTAELRYWRKIINCTTIHFDTNSAEIWVKQHCEDSLLEFFLRHPYSKGAIIVNSIASAKRIARYLKEYMQQPHIVARLGRRLEIGENTGFSGKTERERSKSSDIIVGTSTIDVGVDFKINLLIFESVDSGTFLQRLGRLGRHDGYIVDDGWHRFDMFVAYALVPEFIQQRLFEGWMGTQYFQDSDEISRETLRDAIVHAFPPVNSFDNYAQYWGGLQAGYILNQLGSKPLAESYESVRNELGHRYKQALELKSMPDEMRRSYAISKSSPAVFEEARSFRGSSVFDCGVIDLTEPVEADQFKTYDLFSLLANTECRVIQRSAFLQAAERVGLSASQFQQDRLLTYFKVEEFREERENFIIRVQHNLGDCKNNWFGKAHTLTGITVEMPQHPDQNAINAVLQGKSIVCLLVKQIEPRNLKARLHLPRLFGVYPMQSLGTEAGSIVFGKEALMLECALRRWRGAPLPTELCFIL